MSKQPLTCVVGAVDMTEANTVRIVLRSEAVTVPANLQGYWRLVNIADAFIAASDRPLDALWAIQINLRPSPDVGSATESLCEVADRRATWPPPSDNTKYSIEHRSAGVARPLRRAHVILFRRRNWHRAYNSAGIMARRPDVVVAVRMRRGGDRRLARKWIYRRRVRPRGCWGDVSRWDEMRAGEWGDAARRRRREKERDRGCECARVCHRRPK